MHFIEKEIMEWVHILGTASMLSLPIGHLNRTFG
jgi:hypothetical protein